MASNTVTLLLLALLGGVPVLAADQHSSVVLPVPVRTAAEGRPAVVVHVLFPATCFSGGINRATFDDLVASGEVDRTLIVPYGSTFGREPRALWNRLADIRFRKAVTGEFKTIDVRYRIDLRDGDHDILTLYATTFGLVIWRDDVLVPDGGIAWLRAFLGEVVKDLVIGEHPSQ